MPKRVLVVESDRATRELIEAILVADGNVVDGAPSVAAGAARVAGAVARHGRYDLLLVAPELPDGRGSTVVDRARAQWGDVRVGMLVPGDPAGREAARRRYEPFADFALATPVRPEELLALAATEG